MKEYSRVKLTTNKYIDEGIGIGAIGYIIDVYPDNKYEVEFSNRETGETIAQIVAHEDDLELNE
jgi:hypothetical protein